MKDEKFDKQMEAWARAETEAAPKLQPTAEMYRQVELLGRRARPFWNQARWITAGIAVAAIVLLIAARLILWDPAAWFKPEPIQEVAFVQQRPGPESIPQAPKGGKGRDSDTFQLLSLQVSHEGTGEIKTFDLREPQPRAIDLAREDVFRLVLHPSQPNQLYVYLVGPDHGILALHPETGFNPLRPLQTTLLPFPPDWFYLSGEGGAYRLLLVTTSQAIPDLDSLYQQYLEGVSQSDGESARHAFLVTLYTLAARERETLVIRELTLNFEE